MTFPDCALAMVGRPNQANTKATATIDILIRTTFLLSAVRQRLQYKSFALEKSTNPMIRVSRASDLVECCTDKCELAKPDVHHGSAGETANESGSLTTPCGPFALSQAACTILWNTGPQQRSVPVGDANYLTS
jgi:hypothetical protein